MQYKTFFISLILLSCLWIEKIYSQNVVTTTGNNALSGGGSVSYSVGQVVYIKNTGLNGSATQGVQQPFEISTISNSKEYSNITLRCSVFPNPTSNHLVIIIQDCTKKGYSYQLFDMNGKLIANKKIEEDETNINMTHFVPSTYFLNVIHQNTIIKTFKIIKN